MLGGVVYWTVLCNHPYLVSILFADLLSLHLVTFLKFFIVHVTFFGSRCMLELKFAIYHRAASLPMEHQPYFQWGGNLGTKEMDTMETMHNTWINVVPFLRRDMQSNIQVALLASATAAEYTHHMGRRHMCVASATNVHTSICEHVYLKYNTLVVPTVHTSGVDLQ